MKQKIHDILKLFLRTSHALGGYGLWQWWWTGMDQTTAPEKSHPLKQLLAIEEKTDGYPFPLYLALWSFSEPLMTLSSHLFAPFMDLWAAPVVFLGVGDANLFQMPKHLCKVSIPLAFYSYESKAEASPLFLLSRLQMALKVWGMGHFTQVFRHLKDRFAPLLECHWAALKI